MRLQAESSKSPCIFDFIHVGILFSDIHAADIRNLLVNRTIFLWLRIFVIFGFIGQLFIGINEWFKHLFWCGQICNKVTHYPYLQPFLGFFSKQLDKVFADHIVMDCVNLMKMHFFACSIS